MAAQYKFLHDVGWQVWHLLVVVRRFVFQNHQDELGPTAGAVLALNVVVHACHRLADLIVVAEKLHVGGLLALDAGCLKHALEIPQESVQAGLRTRGGSRSLASMPQLLRISNCEVGTQNWVEHSLLRASYTFAERGPWKRHELT
eukprot:2457162-Pyramimonas_sp.AAC.1